jgi:hypothetical protein
MHDHHDLAAKAAAQQGGQQGRGGMAVQEHHIHGAPLAGKGKRDSGHQNEVDLAWHMDETSQPTQARHRQDLDRKADGAA